MSEFFYSNLFDQAESILKSYTNKEKVSKLGLVVSTQTTTWVQYYDFASTCLNCSKRENIIDFGIATPQVNYNFGDGNANNLSIKSYTFDFGNPDLIGLSAYGMAYKHGAWHGNKLNF